MSNLYERIETLCKERGIDVTKMCRETKVARSSLSELKAGRTKSLSTEYARRIANYFDVSIDFLVKGEGLANRESPTNEKTPQSEDQGDLLDTSSATMDLGTDDKGYGLLAAYSENKDYLDESDTEDIELFIRMKAERKRVKDATSKDSE